MWLSLFMDGAVALLLLVTITYVVRLNNRLAILRQDRDHLGETVKALQTASRQAEEAVLGLKLTASEAGQSLQAAIDKANLTKNDLNFLIEKSDTNADRMETMLRTNRVGEVKTVRTQPTNVKAKVEAGGHKEGTKTGAERLSRLLRQTETAEKSRHEMPSRPEPIQERLTPSAPDHGESQLNNISKSRAERDLQRALEARR